MQKFSFLQLNKTIFKKLSSKGFTLVELLIVLSIFSIVIISITTLFVDLLRNQLYILSARKMLGEISYLGEFISRQIRMSKTDTTGSCVSAGKNFEIINGGEGIKFLTQDDKCYTIYLDSLEHQIMIQRPDGVFELTSKRTKVEKLLFRVSGNIVGDTIQPFVTLKIEATPIPKGPKIIFQTGISKRNPDVS